MEGSLVTQPLIDKVIRNTLRSVVTQCRCLLEEALTEVLEGQFGIYASGKVDEADCMGHLSEDDQKYREQLLIHLKHIQAAGSKAHDAVERMVREVAFTHLNRFCAYKMMETRKLMRKAVSDGLKSQGFLFYLAEHTEEEYLHSGGQQDVAYRHFLEWLGGTLSEEIGVLFSPHDPANRLLPTQRVLDSVLELLNSEELKDIWVEDETIGWVYQYFTPKELRDKVRKESQAPRNSYELALRNQFYTPSYVVQFLTDNTLGRIWYEMRKGETALKEQCQYLVLRPNEMFLSFEERAPAMNNNAEDLSQEELIKQPLYIPHRPKKDPREIKVLDPACGSGHFLLYCFTLLLIIYEEAYYDSELGSALQRDYSDLESYRKAIPGLILAHNLHGIDIDIRATQIAALALWLRAQRAYQKMGITKKERPKITKSNIVCAEPMPGEKELLDEFVVELQPTVLGQLVRVVFNKMKLAGEVGSLLKIEEEIKDTVDEAKKQWKEESIPKQLIILPEYERPKPEQMNLFDVADVTDEEFWNQAEGRVVEALRDYATRAVDSNKLLRQLFADDAAQGFAFVDICRKRFDVVLMNPPFGFGLKKHFSWLKENYLDTYVDMYAAFISRALQLCKGRVGAITARSFLITPKLTRCRSNDILPSIYALLDLGWSVMDDATVQSCASVLDTSRNSIPEVFPAIDRKFLSAQEEGLDETLSFNNDVGVYFANRNQILQLPQAKILYALPSYVLSLLNSRRRLGSDVLLAKQGMKTFNDFRFLRLRAEVEPKDIGVSQEWETISKGGPYAVFYSDLPLLVRWAGAGAEIAEENKRVNGQTAQARQASTYYRRPGGTYSYRSSKDFGVRVLPAGCVIGNKGPAVLKVGKFSYEFIIGFLNSRFINLLVHLQANAKQYDTGIIEGLPWVEASDAIIKNIEGSCTKAITVIRHNACFKEIDTLFSHLPFAKSLLLVASTLHNQQAEAVATIKSSITRISNTVDELYHVDSQSIKDSIGLLQDEESKEESEEIDDEDEAIPILESIVVEASLAYLSFAIGCIFGRWDIRIIKDKSLVAKLPNPFDPLPICPPATLVSLNGFPATIGNIVSKEWLRARPDANTLPLEGTVQQPTISDSEYPITVDWKGILVDDPDHPGDIIRHVQHVLEVIWGDRAEAIEQEACEILGVKELRDYFRKPGNDGFWTDHIKRYSKSRRKAPIYWLLQSSKKNYALWIYYHRLDKDILFKALVNYVEPKLRLEESNLEQLRSQKAAGTSGKVTKQLEKQIDRQEAILSELRDFQDKLHRAANFNLEPDLNDGVVLNIAPLWELVPWSEAKKYWEELTDGKYEWSSIGKQLRQKGIVQ